MHYTVWNKQDNIKGLDAQYFIDNLKIQDSDGVFLVYKNGNLQAIEIDRIIKGVYNLDENLTTEEVAQEYIRIKNNSNTQPEKDPVGVDELEKKIDILQAENLELKEVQKYQDKMLMDNTYKMTILEASIGGM